MPDRTPSDPAADMELTRTLLGQVARREAGPLLRVFRPGPTAAFGRLDRLAPGYGLATARAGRAGYVALLRHAGGHAVVYDPGAVVIELIRPEASVIGPLEPRFVQVTDLITSALEGLGVDVAVGELPGEYCPGRFSVHLLNGPKIAGVAQRIIKGASLTTAVLHVTMGATARGLTSEIYRALDLELDPATVGGVSDRYPGLDAEAVARAVTSVAPRRLG